MGAVIGDLILKAAHKFGLPSPIDQFSFSHEALGLLSGIYPDGSDGRINQSALALPAKEVLLTKYQGACWPFAGMVLQTHGGRTSYGRTGEGLLSCLDLALPWMDPKPVLVVLSTFQSLQREGRRGWGGEDTQHKLVRPGFDDLDMLEALESLPPVTALRFSDAVLQALVQWNFPLSTELILRRCATFVQNNPTCVEIAQERMSVLAEVGPEFDAACPHLRALHGLISPDKIDFADVDFTSGFSDVLMVVSRLLRVQVVSRVGTPLNNVDFAKWFQKNSSVINAKRTKYERHMPDDSTDGMVVKIIDCLSKNPPVTDKSEILKPLLQFTSGRGSGEDSVSVGGSAAAVLIGSEALTSEQRSRYLLALYEDDSTLEKLAESKLPRDFILPKQRMVKVEGSVVKAYASAPVRLANLGAWLSKNAVGLDFRDDPDYQAELPRIVRRRVSEQNPCRAKGYDAWVSWLTEEK